MLPRATASPSSPEPLYADPAAREHALRIGMWIFLGSETLLFAGLFGVYAAYRAEHGAAFIEAAARNDLWIGTINTVVLIVSSFFVALAIDRVRRGRIRGARTSLALVLALGATFLVLKGVEYRHHLAEGIAPGPHFHHPELATPGVVSFFTLYYAMTALHALHVVAGMIVIGWLLARVHARRITAARHIELELGGLYWHLVDVVWIFLWPLLYLTG